MRLDQYIKNKKDITRNKAQAIIKSWNVTVWWIKVTKTWYEVNDNDIIVITELDETNYVARSAIKLKWLFESNNMNIENKIALDIWSSTGGFCQILLEKNIWKIYAVDVWTSQLHEKLRSNKKIIVKENTDIRELKQLDDDIDIITCDVSFISLNQIINSINNFISKNTLAILLFKPQFEVWTKYINKKWVVKNDNISKIKLNDFLDNCRNIWLKIIKLEESKMKWENWNKEIFIMLEKN